MEESKNKRFAFDKFVLDAERRQLLKDGSAIKLHAKAFDLLWTLVENYGQVLSKDELLEKVWTGQFVEENNLTVHISALRKIFGEKKGEHRFIVTIPGRGYTFVSNVQPVGQETGLSSANNENYLALNNPNEELSVNETIGQFAKKNHPRGIPESQTSLIGREKELEEIKNLILQDDKRLITLTGAGGTGKTRLAQTVADALREYFRDGAFFVELAGVNNPEYIPHAVAKVFNLKESGKNSTLENLKNFLQDRQTLIVLDNFEHLTSAAPLLKELLAASPQLKILVTSRTVLRLGIEREIRVAPLALPPHDSSLSAAELINYPAITLFVMRARNVKPGFALTDENISSVAEICRKLDGLPLAIELAAARIKLLSPKEIFERLENSLKLLTGGSPDLPSRQRTMRETIEWSYNLLNIDEQMMFRRLAVFAGGFTVEAAERIASTDSNTKELTGEYPGFATQNPKIRNIRNQISITASAKTRLPAINVLDLLTVLVDNNLLEMREQAEGSVRLRMLEVVREFALECLQTSGEFGKYRQNHALFFLSVVEEAEPNLLGEKSFQWLEKLETENDNLRAALWWSLENDAETAARMAAALRYFWSSHTHLNEGRAWLEAALERYGKDNSDVYFKLMHGIGQFARSLGDFHTAEKIYPETLAASKIANKPLQAIHALHGLAALAARKKDLAAARKYTEEQLALSRELGDESKIAHTLASLGDLLLAGGEFAKARPLLEESLELCDRIGNKHVESVSLLNLGAVAFYEQNVEAAFSHFTESMKIALELGSKSLVSCCLDGLAAIFTWCGHLEDACRLAGAADKLRESIGYEIEATERLLRDGYITKLRAALGEKSFETAFLEGSNLKFNQAVALAKVPAEKLFSDDREIQTEIVIESHTISRILIEEDIVEETEEDFSLEKATGDRRIEKKVSGSRIK